MTDQSTIPKYEITDTGMDEKGGSIVYARATTEWINCRGASLQPTITYSTNEFKSSKKDYTAQKWTYESNKITAKNPPTFNLTIAMPKSQKNDFQTLLEMGDTFGLKKIRGGFGLLEVMPGNENGEIYCIIKSINPSENFNNGSATLYRATLTLEQV